MASDSSVIEEPALAYRQHPAPPDQRRAPLFWLLLAVIPGLLGARLLSGVPPGWPLGLATGLALACLCQAHPWRWALAFVPAAALLAASWAGLHRIDFPPAWDHLPPREVVLEARVLEVFPGQKYPDRQYALLEFVGVARWTAELEGQRAFASLSHDADHPLLVPDSVCAIVGMIEPLGAEDPDDFIRSLESRGTHFRLRQGESRAVVVAPPWWRVPLERVRNRWMEWLQIPAEAEGAPSSLLAAMILGERALLGEEQKQAYILSGTMHLFAISGLHVMVVALTLQQALQFLRLPRRGAFAIVLVLLFFYVAVTGFSPSALRAFSMMAFYWLAGILGRAPRPLPAVLASAVLVLVLDPGQLQSVGFQLSYSVVLSILLLGLPLAHAATRRWPLFRFVLREDLRRWQKLTIALRDRLLESLCISCSATIGSAPLIVLHFGVWTPGAVLLNALLIPLAALAVATGVLVLVVNCLGLAALGAFLLHGAGLVLLAMETAVRAAIRIPGFYTELQWTRPAIAYGSLLTLLLLLFLVHEPVAKRRLPRALRLALPALWSLGTLWAFTGAA